MKQKNEIYGTIFCRPKDKAHYIVLHLRKKIPPMGYGAKEIIKMLKKRNDEIISKDTDDIGKSDNGRNGVTFTNIPGVLLP